MLGYCERTNISSINFNFEKLTIKYKVTTFVII